MNTLKRSLGIALWFMFLTFPIMVVRVNTLKNEVEWRWWNLLWVGLGAFLLSIAWRYALEARNRRAKRSEEGEQETRPNFAQRLLDEPALFRPVLLAVSLAAVIFPWLVSTYQVNIMVLALIYVVLGLGLNITVGLAGLLDLGYVAFFAVGAYTYGILNYFFGLGFWTCLPLGGLVGMTFGMLLGFPILRLRGDYLAIVTLGFGSITQIVIMNWEDLTNGAKGIPKIPHPGLFGMHMQLEAATTYTFYLMIALVILTIFVTNRLKDSRIGRAWMALREDEIACVAMGIDMARTKLSAYALGAFWAGLVGVIFAARNAYINPASFDFMTSAIVLSIVVLGGMGSIIGVIIAALALMLAPEYLRAFSEYRILIFGAALVLMMIFRPEGLIANRRREYAFHLVKEAEDE